MLYYRYRAANEVSFKELLYDEVFFCSPHESNDPFDSKTYFEFPKDKEKWKCLLKYVWRDNKYLSEAIYIEEVAKALAANCPLTYDALLSDEFSALLTSIISANNECSREIKKCGLWSWAANKVSDLLHLYKMPGCYFVSFSRANNIALMWSHYASRHEGYCLIFRSLEGSLHQNPITAKASIQLKTPKGLAPSMSYSIPDKFTFYDINYVEKVKPLDAFFCLPVGVVGSQVSEEEKEKIRLNQVGQYLQKHISWEYEKESRVMMTQPIPWLFGDHFEYSGQQRLMHYEPTQLVGIIFGARMNTNNKARLIEIVKERQDRIGRAVEYKRIIFDFAVFEAKLADNAREVLVSPAEIYGSASGHGMSPEDSDFASRLENWENGHGLLYEGKTCTKVCVKE